MQVCIGLIIPFVGTLLGAAMVFFMKNDMNAKIEKLFLGFAAGVMIAASIFSLIVPAINMSKNQGIASWIPVSVGALIGIVFLKFLDSLISYLNFKVKKLDKNTKSKLIKTTMMALAVTFHNIPEGMAVGVTFAGALVGDIGITMIGAFTLAIGIAIQNFPEGAIISMPLKNNGVSKCKSFLYGMASGIVEPIGAIITILLINVVVQILPYLLSFAAGAMIYVVVEDLIPEIRLGKYFYTGVIGIIVGIITMTVLDVFLG